MKITKKRIFKWIVGFIFYGFIILALSFSIANMNMKYENDIANLMGFGLISSSDQVNNRNEEVQKNIILVQLVDVNKRQSLNRGDIITYFDLQNHEFITEPIIEVIRNNDQILYLTASMNEEDIKQPVESSEVISVKIGQINNLGGVFEFLQSPKGFALGILFPVILLWTLESIMIVNVMLVHHRKKLENKFNRIAIEKAEEVESEFMLIRKQLLKDFNIE